MVLPTSCSAASWTAEERAGWQYHQKLTFNNKDQNENLTNFPVLIKLNPTRFNYSQAKDNGEDIRFLDSDDQTLLSYEIEKWTKDGESFIWVKVPQIDAGSQADSIYMYWGNPKAATSQDPASVWSNGFAMVQHLSENSGTATNDSTSNHNNGTKVSASEPNPNSSGKINGAQDFDGSNDYISVGDPANGSLDFGTGDFSVEGWVKHTTSGEAGIVAKYDLNGSQGYGLQIAPPGSKFKFSMRKDGLWQTKIIYSNSDLIGNDNNWHYVIGIRKATIMNLYVDSVLQTDTTVRDGNTSNSLNVVMGRTYSNSDSVYTKGLIDEVRISNTARSSSWISAQYKSMNDEFITFGSEKGPSLKIAEGSSVFDRYAYTDNGMPSFIFSRFTDETYSLHKYFLEVDGAVFVDFIPPNPKDKNNDNMVNENEKDFEDDDKYVYYTDDFLTVRPKKKVLTDGAHSWQAKAINSAGNTQSTLVNYLLVNTHQCNFSKEFFPLVLNGISGIGSNLNYNWRDANYAKTKSYQPSAISHQQLTIDNPLFSLWGIAPMATSVRLTLKDPTTQEQVFRGSTTTNASSQWGINIDQALTPNSGYTAILESANEKGDYIQLPEFKLMIK